MKTNRNWMKRAAMLSAMAACVLAAQDAFAAKDDVATGADVHLEDAASLTPTPMPRAKATPKSSADTYEATGDLGITMRHGDTMRLYFDIDKAYTRITSARLVLYMWDVDYPSATEQDNVYFNGTYVGRLEGLNQGWDYNYFDVPISKITVPSSGESSSRNTVTINVSVDPSGWITQCGSAQLIINGDTFSLPYSCEIRIVRAFPPEVVTSVHVVPIDGNASGDISRSRQRKCVAVDDQLCRAALRYPP